MAIFRKIHTQFWSDPFVQSLSPERKYFYLYLLTNEKTRQCGIYEISTRQISYDTGYNVETILILLDYFVESGKINVSRETNEIAVRNWKKYNNSRSPGVQTCINEEIKEVKNKKLVEWVQSGGTVGTLTTQEEREREIEEEKEREEKQTDKISSIEDWLLSNQIQFEKICMAAKAQNLDTNAVKQVLRKYHLWLTEKEHYPKTKKSLLAGLEKWIINEKTFSNGTHQQSSSNGTTKSGTSTDRIEALKKW